MEIDDEVGKPSRKDFEDDSMRIRNMNLKQAEEAGNLDIREPQIMAKYHKAMEKIREMFS